MTSMLAAHNVNLVFDVGANTGQFAKAIRGDGFNGRIVSFEPLIAAHEQLVASSKNDPLWEVAPRGAIGSENGEIDIHVARNSASSSILNMLQVHSEIAPDSTYVGVERVPVTRLDTAAQKYLQADSIPFLKIDTQGYEDRVLIGARQLLDSMVGVQLELSLIPLYEGQCLFSEMIDQLKSYGFELWALWQTFVDESNGRLIQVDATLFRHS